MAISTVSTLFRTVLLAILPLLTHQAHAHQAALAFQALVTAVSTSSSSSSSSSLIHQDPVLLGLIALPPALISRGILTSLLVMGTGTSNDYLGQTSASSLRTARCAMV